MEFYIHDATTEAGLVWKRKKDENRFLLARNGDMWTIGFQCEYCWIVNLKKREFKPDDPKDRMLCAYLRRFNLDAMWSREPKTVGGNLTQLKKGALLSKNMGLDPINIELGPWPVGDPYGVQVGLEMLASSQLEGRHDKTHQQFDTIRKIRAGFSTAYESSPNGWNFGNMAFKSEKGKTYTIHSMPTESHLFTHFTTGLLKRMGRLVIPEMGLSNVIIHALLEYCEHVVNSTDTSWKETRQAIMNGAFYCTLYGNSLRGHEGLFLEASDLCSHIEYGKDGLWEHDGLVPDTGHVCYPLLGRFKTEYGEQRYMPQTVNITKSGINLRLWIERLVYVLVKEGKQSEAGPAFCHEDGYLISSREMNVEFLRILEIVKFNKPKLFEGSKDIEREYGTSRSFRRGSNSRAKEEGVDKELREFINRWSSFENKKGSTPSMSMAQHYVEAKLIMKRTLVYSRSL